MGSRQKRAPGSEEHGREWSREAQSMPGATMRSQNVLLTSRLRHHSNFLVEESEKVQSRGEFSRIRRKSWSDHVYLDVKIHEKWWKNVISDSTEDCCATFS
jgi:hypothetical protein